jgi:hypothetical protein
LRSSGSTVIFGTEGKRRAGRILVPITFNMLLKAEGIDPRDVRLARHHDNRPECKITPYSLWRRDPTLLEKYQTLQGKDRFDLDKLLASFVRTPSSGKTLFVGLYKVNGKGVSDETDIDPSCDKPCPGIIKYDIARDNRLRDMQGRLVVDWGKGFLAWVQFADRNDKEILESLCSPEDEPFPGYFAFSCRLSEVSDLAPAWIEQLSAAKGVYVLTSASTREHYVGSAAGHGGFFERWKQHAKAGGDAVALKGLAPSECQVSILQVSAGFETDGDIVRTEHAWMKKLQSRSMGLNWNPATAAWEPPEGGRTPG